jgi:hypothetical protein
VSHERDLSERAIVYLFVDDVVDAPSQAWRNLIDRPEVVASIGMRDWAPVGHSL